MSLDVITESDLEKLIGEPETMVLEFKGPEDFLSWPQKKEKVAEDLSKQVSAFANTYGGQVVIGARETRDPPRRLESLVGVDPSNPAIESIQRLVENNIRPRLEGIRYQTIRLAGDTQGRVVYVITVPQGKTAYQARDKVYYGRSEYESVPLDDQLIRYKMIRDRIAEATIELVEVTKESAQEELDKRQQELSATLQEQRDSQELVFIPPGVRTKLEAPRRDFDRYVFGLSIRNTGPITIRDCTLAVDLDGIPGRIQVEGTGLTDGQATFRLAAANMVVTSGRVGSQTAHARDVKVFPAQQLRFPRARFDLEIPVGADIGGATLKWVLYLEDSPPLSATIPLGKLLLSGG